MTWHVRVGSLNNQSNIATCAALELASNALALAFQKLNADAAAAAAAAAAAPGVGGVASSSGASCANGADSSRGVLLMVQSLQASAFARSVRVTRPSGVRAATAGVIVLAPGLHTARQPLSPLPVSQGVVEVHGERLDAMEYAAIGASAAVTAAQSPADSNAPRSRGGGDRLGYHDGQGNSLGDLDSDALAKMVARLVDNSLARIELPGGGGAGGGDDAAARRVNAALDAELHAIAAKVQTLFTTKADKVALNSKADVDAISDKADMSALLAIEVGGCRVGVSVYRCVCVYVSVCVCVCVCVGVSVCV